MDDFLATTVLYDKDALEEVNDFLWNGQTRRTTNESNNGSNNGGVCGYTLNPSDLHQQVRDACNMILIFNHVGDAAGTATLFGILCFLISVVCLATATQPPAVWIPTVIASLCIFILPLTNSILAIGKFSAVLKFSNFSTNC